MTESLHNKHIRQVEQITEDFRKLKLKIMLLGDMQGLSKERGAAVDSLMRGLDGVRGTELGIMRQSFGLDQKIIGWNQQLRKADPR